MAGARNTLFLSMLFSAAVAGADEAVTQKGLRYDGLMRKTDFLVSESGKPLAHAQIQSVKFPGHAPTLPRCRPWHRLLFSGEQRIAGELLALGPKEIRFRASDGNSHVVPRHRLLGVVQTDGHLVQWAEDFEGSTPSWQGTPTFSDEHAFAGKKSLVVRGESKEISLTIPSIQKQNAASRATIHFFEPAAQEEITATLALVFEVSGNRVPVALFLSSHAEYRSGAGYGLKASSGWHIVQIDWQGAKARIFIDDFLVTSQTIPTGARLASCRFSAQGQGAMWFDSMWLAEIAPPARRVPGPPELDEVWLASGEQLFGELTASDERGVTFDARFGKRTYPWSDVRGIFFRSDGQIASAQGIEAYFQSAPGISSDCLRGEIVDLNEQALTLRHAELGNVIVARSRLERIRFPALASK